MQREHLGNTSRSKDNSEVDFKENSHLSGDGFHCWGHVNAAVNCEVP